MSMSKFYINRIKIMEENYNRILDELAQLSERVTELESKKRRTKKDEEQKAA